MNDNDKVQVAIPLAVPLAGTTSSARPLDGRRILALEQAATFQGDVVHLEHSPDGLNFSPLVSVERSANRLILLDLPEPRDGLVRIRLDVPQANVSTFFVTTR
jgi:hypothetical protein